MECFERGCNGCEKCTDYETPDDALTTQAPAEPKLPSAKLEDVGAGFIADCPYCIRTIHFNKPAPAPWSKELGLDVAAPTPVEPARDALVQAAQEMAAFEFSAVVTKHEGGGYQEALRQFAFRKRLLRAALAVEPGNPANQAGANVNNCDVRDTTYDTPLPVFYESGTPLVRADGWKSYDGGLSWRNPAPHAAQPMMPTSHTMTVSIGGHPAGAQGGEAPAIEWPKSRSVKSRTDMHPTDALEVGFDDDNDVMVSLWTECNGYSSVEFCNGGGGGGKHPNTRLALIALMVAMEKDAAGSADSEHAKGDGA